MAVVGSLSMLPLSVWAQSDTVDLFEDVQANQAFPLPYFDHPMDVVVNDDGLMGYPQNVRVETPFTTRLVFSRASLGGDPGYYPPNGTPSSGVFQWYGETTQGAQLMVSASGDRFLAVLKSQQGYFQFNAHEGRQTRLSFFRPRLLADSPSNPGDDASFSEAAEIACPDFDSIVNEAPPPQAAEHAIEILVLSAQHINDAGNGCGQDHALQTYMAQVQHWTARTFSRGTSIRPVFLKPYRLQGLPFDERDAGLITELANHSGIQQLKAHTGADLVLVYLNDANIAPDVLSDYRLEQNGAPINIAWINADTQLVFPRLTSHTLGHMLGLKHPVESTTGTYPGVAQGFWRTC